MGPDVESLTETHRIGQKVKYRHVLSLDEIKKALPAGYMIVHERRYKEALHMFESLPE